jgi:hypothetical protein
MFLLENNVGTVGAYGLTAAVCRTCLTSLLNFANPGSRSRWIFDPQEEKHAKARNGS